MVFAASLAALFGGLLLLTQRSPVAVALIGLAVAGVFFTAYSSVARPRADLEGKTT